MVRVGVRGGALMLHPEAMESEAGEPTLRSIHLIRVSEADTRTAPPSGEGAEANPSAVTRALDARPRDVEAVLVFDEAFPLPADSLIERLLAGPADVWHAGLALGLEGQPAMLDHVEPLSMFSAQVDPTIEATSWRLSMRALLVRTAVLDQLGGLDPAFETLTGAGLDAGFRWIRGGALVRNLPTLVPAGARPDTRPSMRDGLRLVSKHKGRLWAGWAAQRSLVSGESGVGEAVALIAQALRSERAPLPHYRPLRPVCDPAGRDRTVSVIVPTVDRYPYLVPLLHQLAAQTVAPHEVIVVDQTPLDHRRTDLAEIEPALPVTVLEIPEPGQSSARNAALRHSTGELVLLLDDDLDISPTLLADHIDRLTDGIDAISGGVDDATAGPPPEGFRHRRASDVFPAGNSIVRRVALARSGLFDVTFDHGPRADHDIGMRLHLSGAVLVYDPDVEVYHHHAPVGGLRTHGARKITRAGARRSLTRRQIPAATELYLGLRYFNAEQRREARGITILSTMSCEGTIWRRLARAVLQTGLLPSTLRRLRRADAEAKAMFQTRAPIPTLGADD